MHLFRPDERCDKCRTVGGLVVSSEPAGANVSSSYAFKNPYFTDERVVSDAATAQDSPSAVSRLLESTDGKGTFSSQSALSPADAASKFDFNTSAAAGLLRTASSSEQMHFIESHIANLHSRQVTSSVKELSLGKCRAAQQPRT